MFQSRQCSSVPLPFIIAQREKYIQWGISESLLKGVNPGSRGADTLSQCLLRTYSMSTVLGTVGKTDQALNSVETDHKTVGSKEVNYERKRRKEQFLCFEGKEILKTRWGYEDSG